jgi:8-oxo-dGTP pyrophosphatase MutT (NUDIX family)
MAELWDIYDVNRIKTGRTVERGKPLSRGEYHIVVDVWICNKRGQWLISKRTPNKVFPNMWAPTGGSALAGEDSLTAALREVKEELGIDLEAGNGRLYRTLQRHESQYPAFKDIWVFDCDVPIERIVFQEDETCGAMWASKETIYEMLDRGEFIGRDILPYIDELL